MSSLLVWLNHFLFPRWTHSLSSDNWSSMWTCWLPLLLTWLRLFQVFELFSWCSFPVRGLKRSKDLRPKTAIPVQNQPPLQFLFLFYIICRIDSTQNFPDGGRQPQKGAPIYNLAKFCRKLLENEVNGFASKTLLCRFATTKTFVEQ